MGLDINCQAEKNSSCVMFIKFNLIKFINNKFLNLHKKTWSCLRQKKMYFCLFLFNCVFPLEHVFMRSAENQISSRKYLLDLIKRRSSMEYEVYQRNMSQKQGLILTDDLYESIRAELWLVYQIPQNNHFWQIIVFCFCFSTFH